MVKAPSRLKQLLEPLVIAMGYELVGMEYIGQGRRRVLRLYIDKPTGVTVDDCGRLSHQVSGVLEVEDPIPGPYTLEISSPGLDRPLFEIQDFERFIGHKVHVKLFPQPTGSIMTEKSEHDAVSISGRSKVTGLLKGTLGAYIVVEEQGHELVVPLERIEKANLIPEIYQPKR
ncbi:ribosome maturation factor RimP [Gammaproteobacteria bacterium]